MLPQKVLLPTEPSLQIKEFSRKKEVASMPAFMRAGKVRSPCDKTGPDSAGPWRSGKELGAPLDWIHYGPHNPSSKGSKAWEAGPKPLRNSPRKAAPTHWMVFSMKKHLGHQCYGLSVCLHMCFHGGNHPQYQQHPSGYLKGTKGKKRKPAAQGSSLLICAGYHNGLKLSETVDQTLQLF